MIVYVTVLFQLLHLAQDPSQWTDRNPATMICQQGEAHSLTPSLLEVTTRCLLFRLSSCLLYTSDAADES